MAISHLLEDFSAQALKQGAYLVTEDAFEESRLAAFENGYKAGWDDASAAHNAEQAHISSDFSQNLQALNFTYQEAYGHVLGMLKPLLTQMVESILPSIAKETLGIRIVSEVMNITRDHSNIKIDLIMSPESRTKLQSLGLKDLQVLANLLEDNSLTDGQVFIKFGQEERSIDLDSLITDIDLIISEFIVDFERNSRYG